jgi:DNA-binding response OmpR family regulator
MTWPQYRRRQCTVGDFTIDLSPLETELLSTLLIRYPAPMRVGELIEVVYPNPDAEPDWAASVITKALRSLAHKVGAFRLEFVQRVGYRLCQVPDDIARAA